MGVGDQRHTPAALPWERPGAHYIGAGWASGPDWTDTENLAPTGIRSPDRTARSESLYRLSYHGPHITQKTSLKCWRQIMLIQIKTYWQTSKFSCSVHCEKQCIWNKKLHEYFPQWYEHREVIEMLFSGWHGLANCHTHTLEKNRVTNFIHITTAAICLSYLFLWRQFSPFPLCQVCTNVSRELWRNVEQCRSLLNHKSYHSWHGLWINVNSLGTELQQAL